MWGQLLIDSLVRPRATARRVLAFPIEPAALLQAGVAVTCIGLVLGYAALWLSSGAVDPVSARVLRDPLMGALAQFATFALVAFLTFRVGRLFGGAGGFWGSVRIVVWLSVVTLTIQLAQLVALAVVPPLALLIGVATLFWLMWAYANFVSELHGFASPLIVLGVTVLVAIGLVFAFMLIAGILGIAPQGVS